MLYNITNFFQHVIQSNALEDLSIPDKQQWESAATFLEKTIAKKLDEVMNEWSKLIGPNFTERWMFWKYTTPEQVRIYTIFVFSWVTCCTIWKHPYYRSNIFSWYNPLLLFVDLTICHRIRISKVITKPKGYLDNFILYNLPSWALLIRLINLLWT